MSSLHLLRLKILAERHAPDDAKWLANALERVRAGEKAGVAFELAGRAAAKAAERELLQAASMLDPECQLAAWHVAGMLVRALDDFKVNRWPLAKGLDRPDTLKTLDRLLWAALMCSEKLPGTQENISRLISRSRRVPRSQKRIQDFLTQPAISVRTGKSKVRLARSKNERRKIRERI